MTDKKNFPSVEPPPHPEESGKVTPNNSQISSAPSPLDVMEPTSVETEEAVAEGLEQPISSQSTTTPQEITKMPKKGVPKIVLIILGVMAIVIVFLLIIMFVKNRGGIGGGDLIGTKGRLTWWGLQNEESVVQPLIDEYQKRNPNIKIDYIKQKPNDYRERLTNALASGEGPDIYEMHNSWKPMFRNDLSAMPANIMSSEEYTKTFYPIIYSDMLSEEGIVGIPLEYDALTLYINEDIFTSALKSPPTTWNELTQLATDLTQRGPNKLIIQSGVALGLTDNVDHWPEILALMMLQNHADLAKPQENVTQDAILFYLSFAKGGLNWDSAQPPSTLAFARNKLAMYFAPTLKAANIIKENSNLRFRTIPLPQLPKDNPSDPDFSYVTYWAQGVWKKSKNAEVAWDFLKFASSPESLQSINNNRKASGQLEKAYPRPDMAILQKDDKILGSIIVDAPSAKSWYLAKDTNDGLTGINSQINKVYEEAVGTQDLKKAVIALPGKINEILTKYTSKR